MRWNAPLSDAHASMLLDEFELERAGRVLDLGCGWGELLLRAVQRSPTLTGLGVDHDTVALVRGWALITERGLDDRVSLLDAGAGSWTEPADRVMCVGARQIWGGTAPALAALRGLVAPGGRLLYGDGYLEPNPSPLERSVPRHAAARRRAGSSTGRGLARPASERLRSARVGRVRVDVSGEHRAMAVGQP